MPNQLTTSISLHRLAHSRAGDKGNAANISVIAYRPELFPILVEQVTVEKVGELFRNRAPSSVKRYVLPKLGALNFVLEHARKDTLVSVAEFGDSDSR